MIDYKKLPEIARLDRVRRSGLILLVLTVSFCTTVLVYVVVSPHVQPASQTILAVDEPLKSLNVPASIDDSHIGITSSKQNDYVIPPIKNGLAPVISTIPTKQKVVFLGIDDGQNKLPFEFELMKQVNVKATLFLTNKFIIDNPEFFAQFIAEGSLIEDHTIDHKLLSHLSLEQQKQNKRYAVKPIYSTSNSAGDQYSSGHLVVIITRTLSERRRLAE